MIWAAVGEDRNLLYALSWNAAQDAKLAIDANTREILDANPAAERLTGFRREELVSRRAEELEPDEERQRFRAEFRAAAGDPATLKGFHVERGDGRAVPVTIHCSEMWTLAGRLIVICVVRDISEHVERERKLSAQNWALRAYADAAQALVKAQTVQGLLESICHAIVSESAYLAAYVGVAEEGERKPIRVKASAGRGIGYLEGLRLSWSEDEPEGKGPTGICVRTNQLQIMEDSETSPVYGPWRERGRQFGIRSSISIPLGGEMGWRGALVVYSPEPRAFEGEPVEVFERLAQEIVHGVRSLNKDQLLVNERQNLARTQAELNMALSGMVGPIIAAMEMRDPYTAGHQSRVAEIACAIGKRMGWSDDRMHGLRLAALVHDIGKISIPAEILTKPGKLNSAEWAMICLHPETGYAILKDVPFAWPVAEIVLQHHEKIDGSGYPEGLKGEMILPEARVLSVADILEAMASFRPYRPGIALSLVFEELERQAGKKLDAEAVEACVRMIRERQFSMPGWKLSEPARGKRGAAVQ